MNTMRKIQRNLVRLPLRAYTLLESLLTLFVVSFLTILLSNSVRHVFTGVEERLFFLEFESMYKMSQELALSSHQSVVLEFTDSRISNGYDYLTVPPTLRLNQKQRLVLDYRGGNSSLAKIEFSTQQKKIIYQLYIGSGNYKRTEK